MATGTDIEWADATWNPVSGCTRVSAGCDNCYAAAMTHRLEKMGQTAKYGGLTVLNPKGDRHFNGVVRWHEDALTIPLGWRKPRRVFVNSMSDLFHKEVPFEFIDKVFAVMAICPRHTFQVLTKRPERMAEYFAADAAWPLPNVWLGTSVENQQAADERIPHLLRCPAAVRFLSVEPLLGPVDLSRYLPRDRFYMTQCEHCGWIGSSEFCGGIGDDIVCLKCRRSICGNSVGRLGWSICGGESGPGARPCDVSWIRSIVQQCAAANVPVFVKQMGASLRMTLADWQTNWASLTDKHGFMLDLPGDDAGVWRGVDPKGGDMSEWATDLRIRQFPNS